MSPRPLWFVVVAFIFAPCIVKCSLIVEEDVKKETAVPTPAVVPQTNLGYSAEQSEHILEILSAQHGHSMSENFPAFIEDFTRCLSQKQRKRTAAAKPTEESAQEQRPAGWSNQG